MARSARTVPSSSSGSSPTTYTCAHEVPCSGSPYKGSASASTAADGAGSKAKKRSRAQVEKEEAATANGKIATFQRIIAVASHFQLPALKEWAGAHAARSLTVSSVVGCLTYAHSHNLHGLKTACLEFVTENNDAVQDHASFDELFVDLGERGVALRELRCDFVALFCEPGIRAIPKKNV